MILTNNQGFLTNEGKAACEVLNVEVAKILATTTNEIHLRSLGCALMAQVANQVSDAMVKVRNTR